MKYLATIFSIFEPIVFAWFWWIRIRSII